MPLLQAVLQQVAGQQPPQRQHHRQLVFAQLVRLGPHRFTAQELLSGLSLLGDTAQDAVLEGRSRRDTDATDTLGMLCGARTEIRTIRSRGRVMGPNMNE